MADIKKEEIASSCVTTASPQKDSADVPECNETKQKSSDVLQDTSENGAEAVLSEDTDVSKGLQCLAETDDGQELKNRPDVTVSDGLELKNIPDVTVSDGLELKNIPDVAVSDGLQANATGSLSDKLPEASANTNNKGTEDSQLPCDIQEQSDTVKVDDGAIDPYAYLERDEFTTELYKIEISGLPKYVGVHQLKKKLCAVELKPGKIKIPQNGKFAFVNFKCDEDREKALTVLAGHVWKGRAMKVKKANPSADPLMKRRKEEAESGLDANPAKRAKVNEADDSLTVEERLNKAVTPLWNVPYEKQLDMKEASMTSFLSRLGKEIYRNNDDATWRRWQAEQEKANGGLLCKLQPIKRSPTIDGYRNKCEFTIGRSVSGTDNTVGFRLGSYRGGSVSVVEPTACLHVPEVAKKVVKSLQNYLQSSSKYSAFNPEDRTGHWRTALVRTVGASHVLLCVMFHPQGLAEGDIQGVKDALRSYFAEGDGKDLDLTSLYFLRQTDRNDGNDDFDYEHLLGETHLQSKLLDLNFRISPGAFFQVNTAAAEVLYSSVTEMCDLTPDTVLLDICCGTGTIGLTMAKKVKQVVGIEMCASAVADAKVNATLNGVTNAEYHCGKAEDVLPALIKRLWRQRVVAVVDPPRAGLHGDVIKAIRKNTFLRHLLYVSCKPTGALQNLVDLTRSESRRIKGAPFRLLKALPVDLFPYTDQAELLMLLERQQEK